MEPKDLRENRLILILGGARSGKSRFALERGAALGRENVFIATALPSDEEMARRIERHRRERPKGWKTLEEPLRLVDTLQAVEGKAEVVVIDCLTLWLSNLLTAVGESEEKILGEINQLIKVARSVNLSVVAVSNEVGLSIVPMNPLSRRFRDLSGLLHQRWAAEADEVYWMMAGIAVLIKGKHEKAAIGD
jgi:adenosylcobinamide kinase/adenosylcobinamide-phosphate guanylyltransferase